MAQKYGTKSGSKKSPNRTTNRNKLKQAARGNKRTSVGKAKGRSQRSVTNAEKHSVGRPTLAQRSRKSVPGSSRSASTEPRSRRLHGSKSRRITGTPKRTTKSRK